MTPIVVSSEVAGDQPAIAVSITARVVLLAVPLAVPLPIGCGVFVQFVGAPGATIGALAMHVAGDYLEILGDFTDEDAHERAGVLPH